MAEGLRAEVVIERFDPAARTYTAEVDGRTARVTTDTGQTRLIQIGDPPPDVRVRDESPEEAIRSFLELTSHGEVGWRPACELLAESTREAYESSGYPCESLLGRILAYDEYAEFPEPAGSELGELSVRDGDAVVAQAELTHRYEPGEPDQPREKRVTALVPIAEEDDGWRIVLPNWLSSIQALRGETLPTDAEIEEDLRELDDLG